MKRFLLIPYCFVLMNWAAMKAFIWYVRRRELDGVWVEARRSGNERSGRALRPSQS